MVDALALAADEGRDADEGAASGGKKVIQSRKGPKAWLSGLSLSKKSF